MYPPCFFQAHFVFFNCLLVFLLLFSLMLIDLLDMWMVSCYNRLELARCTTMYYFTISCLDL